MRRTNPSIPAGALALGSALTVALAGCSGSGTGAAGAHSGHRSSSSAPAPTASAAAAHNSADVMFAQMMIPHHRQAVEMAELAATRADSPEVKALAAQIRSAQAPEIATMTGWLASWGEPIAMPGMTGHSGHGMSGMMSAAEMTKLGTMTGRAFEREFLTMMSAHHRGAVDMAKTEQATGRYAPAKQLAADIIRTQTREIAKMASLLKPLS